MMFKNNPRIVLLEAKLKEARAELHKALADAARGEVADHTFRSADGPLRLSALFGEKRDLFVIHNMGTSCPQCSMWADGFNGFYPHLAQRASCVVASPDPPEVQAAFASSRGWRFPMVCDEGGAFAAAMGFADDAGRVLPGVSVLRRDGARIVRVSASGFDAGFAFGSPVWHLLDLLPEGAGAWKPRQDYG